MRALILLLALAGCGRADTSKTQSFDHRPIQQSVASRLAAGDTTNLAAESFDAMFATAERMLRERGHQAEAAQLDAEWTHEYRAKFTLLTDAGDHKPVSEWIEQWYQKLYDILGDKLMEMSHLKDIWVLNYTIPVVFHASSASPWCAEDLQKHPDDTCKREYARHFVGTKYPRVVDSDANIVTHHGFSGVVTYWLVWAGCEAATYGTGWFVVCTPAGDLAEYAIEKWVAPKVSDDLYDRANQ